HNPARSPKAKQSGVLPGVAFNIGVQAIAQTVAGGEVNRPESAEGHDPGSRVILQNIAANLDIHMVVGTVILSCDRADCYAIITRECVVTDPDIRAVVGAINDTS